MTFQFLEILDKMHIGSRENNLKQKGGHEYKFAENAPTFPNGNLINDWLSGTRHVGLNKKRYQISATYDLSSSVSTGSSFSALRRDGDLLEPMCIPEFLFRNSCPGPLREQPLSLMKNVSIVWCGWDKLYHIWWNLHRTSGDTFGIRYLQNCWQSYAGIVLTFFPSPELDRSIWFRNMEGFSSRGFRSDQCRQLYFVDRNHK